MNKIETKIIIRGKELWDGMEINLSEAIELKPVLLTEELSKTDMTAIAKLIDKKLNDNIKEIVEKEITGTKNEKFVVDIVRNCIGQLYKQLWSKRTAWLSGIVNKPN